MRTLKLLVFLFVSLNAFGQQNLKPLRVSVVVSDMETSVKWYGENLGFKVYKEISFPEYDSLRIHFLRNSEGFEFEMLEKKTSFSIKEYVKDHSVNNKPMLSYYKVAFQTMNIHSLFERMKVKEVRVILGVTHDDGSNGTFSF